LQSSTGVDLYAIRDKRLDICSSATNFDGGGTSVFPYYWNCGGIDGIYLLMIAADQRLMSRCRFSSIVRRISELVGLLACRSRMGSMKFF
jgi:hypothetical protein